MHGRRASFGPPYYRPAGLTSSRFHPEGGSNFGNHTSEVVRCKEIFRDISGGSGGALHFGFTPRRTLSLQDR
jgi:hypothetical protein